MWLRIVARRRSRSTIARTALPRPDLALDRLERERLVVANAVDVDHPRAAGRGLHQAGVRDLAAALRIERALLQLREQPAVRALGHAQHGLRLGGLVADEARAEARLAREAEQVLVLDVDSLPPPPSAVARVRELPRRETSRARSISSSKPWSSTDRPSSASSSFVIS